MRCLTYYNLAVNVLCKLIIEMVFVSLVLHGHKRCTLKLLHHS